MIPGIRQEWPAGGCSTWIKKNVRWLARHAMVWDFESKRAVDLLPPAPAATEQVRMSRREPQSLIVKR
jgi:hypothetical protein